MILDPIIERLRRADPGRVDLFLALALAVLGVVGAIAIRTDPPRDLTPLSLAVLLVMTLPLAFRRRWPLRVLVVIGVATVANSWIGNSNTAANLGVLFALYTVAVHTPRSVAVSALLWTFLGITIAYGAAWAAMRPSIELLLGQLAQNYLVFGAAWLLGDLMRTRNAWVDELEQRNAELVAQREENARLAVIEERTRIARELHDIVAHHVSVMVVQAGAARRALDGREVTSDGPVATALVTIESTGRDALAEMRRMLGALRMDEATGLEPLPGLARLDALLDQVREAGLPVEFVVEGVARPLPAGVDLSAYRIVQESLTNSLKHGGRAHAHVTLRYGARDLEVEVVDDGRAAPVLDETREPGHGIAGMRERVALFGGALDAGPRLSGGYAVTARIPLEAVGP